MTTLIQAGNNQSAETQLRALLQRVQVGPYALLARSQLATVLENQGRLGEALANANAVYAELQDRPDLRSPNTIAALGNLGRLYAAVGQSDRAAEIQRNHVRLAVEVNGAWHESAIAARNNLANTYRSLGRLPEAIALQESALEASGRIHAADSLQMQVSRINLARSYLLANRPDRAEVVNAQALATLERTRGSKSSYILAARVNEVAILDARALHGRAIDRQKELLADSVEVWGEHHRFTLEQISLLAQMYAKQGAIDSALGLAQRYVQGAEIVRVQPGLSREERGTVFAGYADTYRMFSGMLGQNGREDEGFRIAELSKARTLLESMSATSARRSEVLPALDREHLDRIEVALRGHERAISESADATARSRHAKARDETLREHDVLVAHLKATHTKFSRMLEPRILSGAGMRGVVPRGAIYVGFTLGAGRVSAWLVDDQGATRFVDLGNADGLAQEVEMLRDAASAGRTDGTPRGLARRSVMATGPTALGKRLLQPLSQHLRGRQRWIISPDGPLARLPFELLELDGRRVLEQVTLHYTQSLSVYATVGERQREYRNLVRPKDLLAFGDPAYVAAEPQNEPRRAALRAAPLLSEDQLRDRANVWTSLPGSQAEVAALRRIFPNGDAYLRRDASEAQMRSLNQQGSLKGYRYLHFATHGNLSARDAALSSIVLRQIDLEPDTDGHITAAEWPGYDLRSDITVLSACETGLGSELSGEGVMGLPFALFVAGNVNTVLSLWPVFDDVTPVFMEKFFGRLKAGQDTAQALTQTKRELAADPRTAHPANWAAFILFGVS